MKSTATLILLVSLSSLVDGKQAPPTHVKFEKVTLLESYISEGASIADINADGKMDVIAGPLWWQGPDFKESFSYAPVKMFPTTGPGISGYSNNFLTFPDQITDDKWPDVLKVGVPGVMSHWAKNPGEKPFPKDNTTQTCQHCEAQGDVCNESPQYLDVIGDGKKELLAYSGGHLTLALPHAEEEKSWPVLKISPHDAKKFHKYQHGLGAGDINSDGLTDIVEKTGWWEQPKDWDRKTAWTHHPYPFAPKQGGAQMYCYDLDGDGDNDVVTALNAHAYGLVWYEQVREGNKISFKSHTVMTDKPEGNPYGVCFSQPHAMACVDIDGDGIKDFITGKRYFAHNGRDPGANDPAVLYWFRTTRQKDGQVELTPHLIDDNSGVGCQISTGDINGDGKMDIAVSNKKGVFAFIQQ